ncbi:MAG TPA: YbhB/YbcL family Raf kinase inhibitor-like protein, partial [Chitinophagaceae bacterium]
GINDFRRNHYYGPCPGKGIEHYVFRVFALDAILDMPLFAGRKELEKAMGGHILATGEITGKYKRVDFIGHVHRLKQQA